MLFVKLKFCHVYIGWRITCILTKCDIEGGSGHPGTCMWLSWQNSFRIPSFPLTAVSSDAVIVNEEAHMDKFHCFSSVLYSSNIQTECCEHFLPFWKSPVWVMLVCVIVSCGGMEEELSCDWSMCYWFTICEMLKDVQNIYSYALNWYSELTELHSPFFLEV